MRHTGLSVLALFLLVSTTAAQETAGGIRGRLVSPVTGAVVNATVTATSPDLLGERRVSSGPDGVFQFALLPPGTYTLRVRAIGHRPLVIDSVAVRLGRFTGLGELALEPAAVQLGEITITAPAATLDPVRTTVGATLTAEDYAVLPAERDYKSAIAILPHVNTSYNCDPVNVGGSTGLENMYFVDGVNVTSELDATTGISLPYNFVRAVEVKAGGYEAQYGKALGAVVNALTYSGTNELETAVFGFFTGAALTAEPKALPELKETGAVSYDVGARVSGPVARDRLWFSAAYNPRIDRVDKEVTGLGIYTDRRTAHLFAGKLTWQASPALNLALSVFGDPTTHHVVDMPDYIASLTPLNADPLLRLRSSGGVAGALRGTATPTPWLLLEGSVGYSRTKASDVPNLDTTRSTPHFVDYVAATVSGYGNFSNVTQGRTTGVLRGTAGVGRHTVVVGAEYEDARVTSQTGGSGVERQDSAVYYTYWELSAPGTYHNRLPTAYLQDTWRVTDRLTVNAGLRWSTQTLTGASGGTAQTFPGEWQPRLGLNWQLGRSGMHRVFGSYGRFYQQIPLNLGRLWYVDYYALYSWYSEDPRQGSVTPYQVYDGSTYEADWAKSIPDLEVENFDEFTAGYEGLFGATRLTVRGIRRDLRSSFQWGINPGSEAFWVLGTPGKGDFAFLPPPKRNYTALELSATGGWQRLQYRASYVLSRSWGNHSGLFWSDGGIANPGGDFTFFSPDQAINSEGLLPNDRTHVVKLVASYRTKVGFTPGVFFTWMSGTPINDFGPATFWWSFISPRGTAGRTPAIWDLNVRLAYDTPWPRVARTRVIMDFLHLGNPRETVLVDQRHYYAEDANGNPTNVNSNYLAPTAYQPPMTARLGLEISF
jgi:hypothetical protein